MTPSEEFVYELANKTFLPFWSFANPIGKKDKELCDVLVICDNVVIIISVKEIKVSEGKNIDVQYERWIKKAIHASCDQIHGAERYILSSDKILLNDRKTWVDLPERSHLKIYRIAVAFGSLETFPLPTGDFGNGFVHVFDEKSTFTIFDELDTITDFIEYLEAKEKFFVGRRIQASSECDFLAFYLQTNFDIGPKVDLLSLDNNLWEKYIKSKEYAKWQNEIKQSFFWDNMINHLFNYHIRNNQSEVKRANLELAIRMINLESRWNRIELGMILDNMRDSKVKARMLKPLHGKRHTYVFLKLTSKNWDIKEKELELRSCVARVENPDTEIIIGISIGEDLEGNSCFDILYLNIPELTNDFINHVNEVKKELGYFKNPVYSRSKDMRP